MYCRGVNARLAAIKPLDADLGAADGETLARALKALGDPVRLQMISYLLEQDVLCVSDFQSALRISQSLASYHLHTLVRAGIVESSKSGRCNWYFLAEGALEHIGTALLG